MCVIKYNIQAFESKLKQTANITAVVKNLELKVPKGQLVGIRGAIGSGKSSLFCCLLGEMKMQGVEQT